ncbi:hypothetical protein NVSP9465_02223 [Novosphingobium sp. CECT 9465]|nr:hypothetical protein NVSP9465_02218 [Novosphingobium sp. CECT 9465]CAH0497171.1 hypothetical protein NVSP9465_02223 [Novosphingobium sp. CECT 9465]
MTAKNLKQARDSGNLDQFAKDHEADAPGDADAFNRALASMARTSKEVPATSKKAFPGD